MITKDTTRITQREYCSSRRVPLDIQEILLQQVREEDEINHAGEPEPEMPEYKEVKVRHPNWVKHLLKGTLGQLIP